MSSLNESKMDENDILKTWAAIARQDKGLQYKYGARKRHIEDLVGALVSHGVSLSDAEMLKRRVVEELVTKKGMSGGGDYKGWKENVERDFVDALHIAYFPDFKSSAPLKSAHSFDPRIVQWAKAKYGANVGSEIIKAAHQPLHMFWCEWFAEYHNLKMGRSK